jgi:glycosyltransferase involved in cell wall biosynthesis
MQTSSILLICYSYPPYPGTGGRRWAKLSKYLAREGHAIHVINAASTQAPSVWFEDTKHPNIRVHSIQNKETVSPEGIFSRLTNKILFSLSKLKTKGNYADQSLWWNDKALACARTILKVEPIDYLIVSCPPYHPLFEFSSLKKDYPGLKLILDYRDIWIIRQKGKGFFSHLDDKRFEVEKQKEKSALASADYIFTVADDMSDSIREQAGGKPVHTLTNGYDEEDFSDDHALQTIYAKPNKINIVFAGSLVVDSNAYAIPFFHAIALMKGKAPELYAKLHLCIFGNVNPAIQKIIDDSRLDCVVIYKPVNSKSIGKLYAQFDYLLLFLIPYYTYAFISKFFDYLPVRKPIISVSEKGRFSEFLEENRLGRNIDMSSMYESLLALLNDKQSFAMNQTFDVSAYSYRHLAKKLMATLQETERPEAHMEN